MRETIDSFRGEGGRLRQEKGRHTLHSKREKNRRPHDAGRGQK
jgi:hypothetical protein